MYFQSSKSQKAGISYATSPSRSDFSKLRVRPSEEKTYKYRCNLNFNVSRICQLKMQFKFIASVLLFFVAQTMATPNPQTARTFCSSTLLFMALPLTVKKINHTFSPILQAILRLGNVLTTFHFHRCSCYL